MGFNASFLGNVNFLIESYEIEPGSTLEQLLERIEFFQGFPVVVNSVTLPYAISGFVAQLESGVYNIFIDASRSRQEQLVVLTHELVHIMLGDVTRLATQPSQTLFSDVQNSQTYNQPQLGTIACRRFGQLDEHEKKVEYIALQIRQLLAPVNNIGMQKLIQKLYEA